MNSCMVVHATQDELDKAREEWFATRVERRKQLQREEAEYQEKLKIKHQMWGVDDQGRPLEKKGYDSAGVLE